MKFVALLAVAAVAGAAVQEMPVPEEQAFVGTWIDTMQTHLWTYRGTLDEARKILTLESEGPASGDPTNTTQYRDAIEIVGADHKVLTSSMKLDDGTWNTFMRADYHRKQ